MTLSRGRDLVAIPGPSVIPDRVLAAMHRAAPSIYEGEIQAITNSVVSDLKRVAKTSGNVALYVGNGHAVWEASLANLVAPGDHVLVLASGNFGRGWANTAERMGIVVELLDFGFRAPPDPQRLEDRLRADSAGKFKAVLAVQVDTASSLIADIPALRAAIDAAGHPALLMADCIACLACDRFDMDTWGVDVALAACQKGLMTPPGVAMTFHNARAEAARMPCASPYWDWGPRIEPELYYHYFCGTAPTHHLYGLHTALEMLLDEEGLEAAWRRHAVLARAVWAALDVWGSEGALEANVADPANRSHAVTTVRTAPGAATRLRNWCDEMAGLTLGIGLCTPDQDRDSLFRIGHMGHLNPPMLLGALGTIEAGLRAIGLPHGTGAVDAAADVISAYAANMVDSSPGTD